MAMYPIVPNVTTEAMRNKANISLFLCSSNYPIPSNIIDIIYIYFITRKSKTI